jgi:hypothetical protein
MPGLGSCTDGRGSLGIEPRYFTVGRNRNQATTAAENVNLTTLPKDVSGNNSLALARATRLQLGIGQTLTGKSGTNYYSNVVTKQRRRYA